MPRLDKDLDQNDFDRFDTNHDGVISRREWGAAMHAPTKVGAVAAVETSRSEGLQSPSQDPQPHGGAAGGAARQAPVLSAPPVLGRALLGDKKDASGDRMQPMRLGASGGLTERARAALPARRTPRTTGEMPSTQQTPQQEVACAVWQKV